MGINLSLFIVKIQYIKKKDELELVKSVFVYDGISEQELSFPADVYIRILRKNQLRKVDGEEWWEGVYEDELGYFPAIFVEQLTEKKLIIETPVQKKDSTQVDLTVTLKHSPENQMVPH